MALLNKARYPKGAAMSLMVVLLIALASFPQQAMAQKGKATTPSVKQTPASSPAAGMVITGDREAPLVLSIIPWVEPAAVVPPDIPLQSLLPKVIDYNRSILDEPDNRPIDAGSTRPGRK